MGNFVSNSGTFEPPGAKTVSSYVIQLEKENDPRWIALRVAQLRAEKAEQAASQLPTPKPKRTKCSICKSYVVLTVNPWQLTRGDLLAAQISDDSDAESDTDAARAGATGKGEEKRQSKLEKRGIQLRPCTHVFCGACLAQFIYTNLHIPFDPSSYGTKLPPSPTALLGDKLDFPMGCPSCQPKLGEPIAEISDTTARLVLGDGNMEEWLYARFLSTLVIIYCPHKNCNEPFDERDIAPAPEGVSHYESLVQCPRCRKSLCKSCKVPWHQKLTCQEYQALPITERAPEDLALTELAKQERWKRCTKCGAMVELKYGSNHITCKCKHHFCYTCGADFQYKNGRYRCLGGNGCKIWDENALLERP